MDFNRLEKGKSEEEEGLFWDCTPVIQDENKRGIFLHVDEPFGVKAKFHENGLGHIGGRISSFREVLVHSSMPTGQFERKKIFRKQVSAKTFFYSRSLFSRVPGQLFHVMSFF